MIVSILVSIERNSEIVGLALNPEDAYSLEKEDKELFTWELKMVIQLEMI